jgi:hypothetical protein
MESVTDQTANTAGLTIACAAATVLLLGCSKQVVVETTFPEPLIEELPLDAGVYYAETLRNYTYEEDLPNDLDWEFELGDANVRMLDRALGALFREMITVDQPGGSGEPYDRLDVVIHPTLEAFEFSLPRQSRSDQYAVWIRYNLAVHAPDGRLITNWPVSAYGQADSRLFRGGSAMEAAVVRAMRDAIANIVIGFPLDKNIAAALLPDTVIPAEPPSKELAAEPVPDMESAPGARPADDGPNEEGVAPIGTATDEIRS